MIMIESYLNKAYYNINYFKIAGFFIPIYYTHFNNITFAENVKYMRRWIP